jgi:hypothetical protein
VTALGQSVLAHHVFDASDGLSGSVFIFDQTEANMIVTKFSESDARGDRDLCFKQNFLGKLE